MLDEDGHAFTAAATWNAKDWLRLTAEVIALDSRRKERVLDGVSADRNDTQIQFSVRLLQLIDRALLPVANRIR